MTTKEPEDPSRFGIWPASVVNARAAEYAEAKLQARRQRIRKRLVNLACYLAIAAIVAGVALFSYLANRKT